MSSMIGKFKTQIEVSNLADGDSIASYLTDASGNLLTSTSLSGKQRLDVINPSERAEDSAHTSGDYGSFVLGVRDDGVQAAAILGPNTFTAVNFGTSGNSIALVFDGIDDVTTVVAAWNAANPSNQVTFTGSGATVPSAQTVTLSGGAFNTVRTSASGDYSPLSVDKYGRLLTATELDVDFDYVYAEDSAHTSGDLGAFSLAVRRDIRSSGVSADGDYGSFNVNNVGELWVKDADVLAQLVLANASLDAIEASASAIESDVDAIRVELLDQGTTLDSILADTATIDSNLASVLSEIQALSFAEDSAHVSGDMGIQALAVRKDSSGSNAADGDYTSIQTWSEGSVKTVDIANSAILQQGITVAATATALAASPLSNRRNVMVQNQGSSSIWIGSATVTSSGATRGIEVPKGGFMEIDLGPAVVLYGITSSGTQPVGVLEAA